MISQFGLILTNKITMSKNHVYYSHIHACKIIIIEGPCHTTCACCNCNLGLYQQYTNMSFGSLKVKGFVLRETSLKFAYEFTVMVKCKASLIH